MKPADAPVAIVTAASRGIGAACARELARRGDTSRDADLARIVAVTLDAWGRIGGVVNNTGHATKRPLLDIADAEAPHGIHMNNLLPGFIDTHGVDAATRERIPAARYGTPAEIACTAAFLPSDDATYITGQNLRVDGGVTRSV